MSSKQKATPVMSKIMFLGQRTNLKPLLIIEYIIICNNFLITLFPYRDPTDLLERYWDPQAKVSPYSASQNLASGCIGRLSFSSRDSNENTLDY